MLSVGLKIDIICWLLFLLCHFISGSQFSSHFRFNNVRFSKLKPNAPQFSSTFVRGASRSWISKAIDNGYLYVSRYYRFRYANDESVNTHVCLNKFDVAPELNDTRLNGSSIYVNRTAYQLFLCPLGEDASLYYCCGHENRQYCCGLWDDSFRVTAIVFAIFAAIVGYGIVACIAILLIQAWTQSLTHRLKIWFLPSVRTPGRERLLLFDSSRFENRSRRNSAESLLRSTSESAIVFRKGNKIQTGDLDNGQRDS